MNTMEPTTTSSTILLSKKGMKELKKSVAKLEHRRDVALADIRNLDKIDNHEQRLERVEKLAQLEIIESELADKKQLLEHAKLFPRKRDALRAGLGSVVELIDMQGRLFRYTLVDSVEADPSDGRISIHSPLGQNLIGKKIRETVQWSSGLANRQMQLVRIM